MEGSDCSVCSAASCAAPCCSSRSRSWPRSRLPAAPRRSRSPRTSPQYDGAEIFHQRCAGCHTLKVAGAQGSAEYAQQARVQGRPELRPAQGEVDQVLYAIRNGGFSSGPMPQNIVVGKEAEAVAEFVAENSGKEAEVAQGARCSAERRAMLDLKAIRRDPDAVRAALARRGDGSDARLGEALALDERRRELLPEVEGLRARQNEASQGIAQAKKAGEDAAGRDRRDAGGLAPGQVADGGARRGRGGARGGARLAAEPARSDRRRTRTTTLREVGERGGPWTAARPPRPGGRVDRHGGGSAASRARASRT